MNIVVDQIGGNCPVQAEGTVDTVPFYFRARRQAWTMGIGLDPVGEPSWHWSEPYGVGPYDAGWMPEDEARGFIQAAAERWASGKPGDGWGGITGPSYAYFLHQRDAHVTLFDDSTRQAAEEARIAAVNAGRRAQEAELRRLLGMWVSELEPVILFENGRMLGLAAGGFEEAILEAGL